MVKNGHIFSIGVTGHRFLAEIKKLQIGIDLVLTRIEQIYPVETWAVVSSLAEGADRLVVERVLQHRPETKLIVPLPLAVPDYCQDFETPESRQEFLRLLELASEVIPPPQVTSRSEGYWLAGKTMLDRCDLLIALWDGRGAQGQGGSGEMVAIARQRELPLAWVHCGNRKPGTNEPVSLGEEQGTIGYERF